MHLSDPDSVSGSGFDPGTASRSAVWRVAAGVHVLIVVVALVVVHATLGGADTPRAGAAVVDRVAAAEPARPVVAAAPRARVRTTVTERPAPPPVVERPAPAAIKVPTPKMSEPAMLAIPKDGGVWPPTMESTRGALSPHLPYGRLYGAPGGTRIVYLIDASGSQVDTLPFVQQALQRAIRSLKPEQSYAVLFFSSDAVREAPPVGMKRATTRAVTQTDRFVDPGSGKVRAAGRPLAEAAIRRALAYQPDTVVLLSDGLTGRRDPLGDRARILSLIDAANASGARFHTLQVRQPDPLATGRRRGTLELIAARTGGVHRFVADADLPVR